MVSAHPRREGRGPARALAGGGGEAAVDAMAEIAHLVAHARDPRMVAQRIADCGVALLSVRAALLYRVDPAAGGLALHAAAGPVAETFEMGLRLPAGFGVTSEVVASGRAAFVRDVRRHPDVAPHDDLRARLDASCVQAVLSVPLVVHGRVLGALTFGAAAGRTFSDADMRVAQALADQAAVALENAELRERQEARAAGRTGEAGQPANGTAIRAAAHDLNNLLTVLTGRSQLMLRRAMDERVARDAELLFRAASQAAELTRQILVLARTRLPAESRPHQRQ